MSDWQHRGDGRFEGVWMPYLAEGYVTTGACATTLPMPERYRPAPAQPIGFRGAAPGASVDARGLPRVRVRAERGA